MPTELHFDLPRTLLLAEHAAAADEHTPSYTEQSDGQHCTGALQWAADCGTYLMSGGRPNLLSDPDDPTSNVVVYAQGWGPDDDHDSLSATDVGGDDFVEHLHLHDSAPGEPSLLQWLRRGAAAGFRYLVISVDADSYSVRLAPTAPATR